MISVIIPVYNVEKYLDQCVQSVIEQSYRDLEIILVDDGSTDSSPEKCDAWEERDSRIKTFHKANGGLSDARNFGLDIACGDYITFVDSDDWIHSSMLETMLKEIIANRADICSCGIINYYESDQKYKSWSIPSLCGDSAFILKYLYSDTKYPVSACGKLFVKRLWEHFRFPKRRLCEDAFTTCLLVDKAERIVQLSREFYIYRIRDNSIMTKPFSRKQMDEEVAWRFNYRFIQKRYPQLTQLAFNFYLQKVEMLIQRIQREGKKEFRNEYYFLYSILKRNIGYVLLKSSLSMKQKISFGKIFFTLRKDC